MKSEEVKAMCRRMGVAFNEEHPDHIAAERLETISPPFMEYVLVDHPIHADGKRYIDIMDLTIRIYSDTEVSEAEEKIQNILEEEDLRWRRASEYIEDLLLWEITYKMEV